MKTITGWWFAPENKRLTNSDNRKIKVGCTHKITGKIIPCFRGLHLSKRPVDALSFAPGPIVYKVKGGGIIVPHGSPINKYACSERTYISGGIDCTNVLKLFAKKCALDVIHLWKASDIVTEYLKTGKEESRAASSPGDEEWIKDDYAKISEWMNAILVAWDATNSIEGSAIWGATNNIMKIITWDTMQTVWSAARATAWDAVKDISKKDTMRDTTWHTTYLDYINKANRRLSAILTKCII